MDQAGLKLEPEVAAVLEHVAAGRSFLLSGGAGSGKTYSLVQVTGELLRTDPTTTIACITYTNAAVHEIQSRVDSDRLSVSTIHDFLWDAIGSFQTGLRTALVECLDGDSPKIKPGSSVVKPDMFGGKTIQYKEYKRLADGIVSHDEVITLARGMFERYPKLRDIVRDRFPYILVDEYQDTAPEVVDIPDRFPSPKSEEGDRRVFRRCHAGDLRRRRRRQTPRWYIWFRICFVHSGGRYVLTVPCRALSKNWRTRVATTAQPPCFAA